MNINEMKKEMALLIEATDNVVEKELNGKLKKVAGNIGSVQGAEKSKTLTKKWPTDNLEISGLYGEPRNDGRSHNGVDIRARLNESVYAVMDGEVISTGSAGLGGNYLKIRYVDSSIGGYAHTKPTVSLGNKVKAGQKVGVSDGSGTKDPHLHYTFRAIGSAPNGSTTNPLSSHLVGFPYKIIAK